MKQNINDITSEPVMFRELKPSFALCDSLGNVIQVFTELESAKYILNEIKLGETIHEVIHHKNKIIALLGEL